MYGVLNNGSNTSVTDDLTKVNLFSDFFSSVFTKDITPTVNKLVDSETTFSDVTFTPKLVFRVLSKLMSKPSAGPDGYPSVLLKALAGSICLPLAIIFAFCFETGTLPEIWRSTIVTPVFKKVHVTI